MTNASDAPQSSGSGRPDGHVIENVAPNPPTEFTDFYIRYCYLILFGLVAVNIGIAAGLILHGGTLASVLTSLCLSSGVFLVLFSFIEDKQRVPFRKRIITLVIAIVLPLAQGIVPLVSDPFMSLTTEDRHNLDHAVKILRDNEYKNHSLIMTEALPIMLKLAKRYPKNSEIRFHLGIAQFDSHYYQDAMKSFSVLVDEMPDDFKSHYLLGISYKMAAAAADSGIGSSTIDAWRQAAYQELNRSLDLYNLKFEAEPYYQWRIYRNIGWLQYERSQNCANKGLCDDAIRLHKKALDRDQLGYIDYIQAYGNLGEIYQALGDIKTAIRYSEEGVARHEAMLKRHDENACKTGENRYVYTVLANLYFAEGRMEDGKAILRKALTIFPLADYEDDKLNGQVRKMLSLVAQQIQSTGEQPPACRKLP